MQQNATECDKFSKKLLQRQLLFTPLKPHLVPQRVSRKAPFTLSLSKGESVIRGSTISPRTDSIDLLDTLLRICRRARKTHRFVTYDGPAKLIPLGLPFA